MIILPAIDLKEGCCVRLVEGRMDSVTVYDGDPLAVAKRWREGGAGMIHIVDLDGATLGNRTSHWDIAEEIAKEGPVEFGGGIRTPEDALALLDRGITRIVIGTLAIHDPDCVQRLLETAPDRVAIGLDARDGVVLIKGWEESSGLQAVDLAREFTARGARRFVYTDVSRDGTLKGPNVEATRNLALAAGVPVTASGGVGTLDDLIALAALAPDGVDSCIVGKALYEGRFTLPEAIGACR